MDLLLTIATLGPLGYIPFSGTVASIASFLVLYPIRIFSFSWYIVIFVVIVIFGCRAISYALDFFKHRDPSIIVWDEVIGSACSLLFIPLGYKQFLVTMILFRIFDGSKILGISYIERMPGTWGVVL